MTDIITLPQIIIKEVEKVPNNSFFIYKHSSDRKALKNKILLQHNLISFLQTGKKVLSYAHKTTIINNEQIAILSSGNCLMTEKLSMENDYCSILFFFDDVALTNFFVKYTSLIERFKTATDKLKNPFIVLEKDDFIKNYIISLSFIIQRNGFASQEKLLLKFEEFMLYLLENYPYYILNFQALKQTGTADFEIKNAVEKNIVNNVTLEELAFLCNISISTFKRRFIKLYNTSPSQYFLQRKMEIAASMLLCKENPSDVSYKVGYENPSSFSQSFKQVYGISPKQYQKRHLVH
ncbi:helix-turn-helix domain-containing protein [Arcicella lustrica]|uniref:AraC family transcriptional regulator n=1 Tax=Arcicella lustrica TaxID=2984196 RepID=A0ABU5SPV8_9BACT|nr:AraC family transcriptional regulator [Arcicella sp. DC25W]MEA5429293.1 AraC family transcriptional regulator [Arcicella sp. DC25W]